MNEKESERTQRNLVFSKFRQAQHAQRARGVCSKHVVWFVVLFFCERGGGEGKVGENGDASLLTFFSALNVAAPLDDPDDEGDGELCSQPTGGCAPRAWPRAKVG